MKEFLEVTALAALQGVAEFLPISSSGHLVIGQNLLGMNVPGMQLDVLLHFGTLLAIFAFYRRRIGELLGAMLLPRVGAGERREAWEFAGKIVASALPAVATYLCFREWVEALFENSRMVGALLMFTGAVVGGTRFLPRGKKGVSWLRALLMGCGQAVALLPGVSRSGMTIASARTGKVEPEKAAEFSFLMSAPLILGATVMEVGAAFGGGDGEPGMDWRLLVWGAGVAAVVGYWALAALVKTLRGRWFWLFGPYCVMAGLMTVLFS